MIHPFGKAFFLCDNNKNTIILRKKKKVRLKKKQSPTFEKDEKKPHL